MSSWFSGASNLSASIGSIKDQVSSSLREVFEEDEPNDPAAQLSLSKARADALAKTVDQQREEIRKIKERNEELSEQKQAVELQKEAHCNHFKDLLREKESELQQLRSGGPPEGVTHQGDADRVAELEQRLRQEREAHQNEMMSLQESFQSSGRYHHALSDATQSPSGTLLRTEWDEADGAMRAEVFEKALRLLTELEHKDALSISASQEDRVNLERTERQLSAVRVSEAELKQKISGLETSVNELEELSGRLEEKEEENQHLRERVQLLQSSLEESNEKCEQLVAEVETFESLLATFKEEKMSFKKERDVAVETINNLQASVKVMHENFEKLKDASEEEKKLNNDLKAQVEEMREQSSHQARTLELMETCSLQYEATMAYLTKQVNALQGSELQVVEFSKQLKEKTAQMSELMSLLKNRNLAVEKMADESVVYKRQYETLLQEYNQYLEDLEGLQKKAEGLESLKAVFEEEIKLLKENSKKDKLQYEALTLKYEQCLTREKEKNVSTEKLEEKIAEIESVLFKERSKRRQQEEELEEQELMIEELKERRHGKEKDSDEIELSHEITSLKEELAQLGSDANKKDEEILLLRKCVDEANMYIDHLAQDKDKAFVQLLEESKGSDEKLDELQERANEVSQLREELVQKESDLISLASARDTLQREFDDYRLDVESGARCFEEQSQQLRSAEAELESFKAEVAKSDERFQEHSTQLDSLQEELDRCIDEMAEERKEFEVKLEELRVTKQELDRMSEEFDELKSNLVEKETALESLAEQKVNVEKRAKDLDDKIIEQQKVIDLLRSERDLFENELEDTMDKCVGIELDGNVAKRHFEEEQLECHKLEESQQAQINDFKSRLLQAEQEKEELEKCNQKLNEQLLEKKLASTDNLKRLDSLQEELDRSLDDREETRKQLEVKLEELRVTKAELDRMSEEFDELKNEYEKHERVLEELQQSEVEAETRAEVLEGKLEEVEAQSHGEKLPDYQRTIENLTKEMELLRSERDLFQEELEKSLNKCMNIEMEEHEDKAGYSEIIIQSLRDQLEEAKEDTIEMKEEWESSVESLRQTQEELDVTKEKLAQLLKLQKDTLGADLHSDSADMDLDSIREVLNRMRDDRNQFDITVEELRVTKAELHRLSREFDELKEIYEQHETVAERLKQVSSAAEAELTEHKVLLEEQSKVLADCQQKLEEKERLCEILRRQGQLLGQELESSMNRCVDIELDDSSIKGHMQELMGDDNRLRKQLAECEAELAKAESKIRDLETKLNEKDKKAVTDDEVADKALDWTDEKSQDEVTAMTKETVNKLSQLIRDKDIEISALQSKNDSLVSMVEKSSAADLRDRTEKLEKEKVELFEALKQKHQENVNYYEEIKRLSGLVAGKKAVVDNSNEIIALKAKIKELERRLSAREVVAALSAGTSLGGEGSASSSAIGSGRRRRRFYSESYFNEGEPTASVDDEDQGEETVDVQKRLLELNRKLEVKDQVVHQKESELLQQHKQLQDAQEQLLRSQEEIRGFKRKAESLDLHQVDALRRIDELKFEAETAQVENKRLLDENQDLRSANNRTRVSLEEKSHDLEMAQRNLQQLTEMLEEKSQNSESIQQERLQSLAAIQELQSSVGSLKRERDEGNLRLKERERELTETRREVNSVIEKKKRLEQELERLREHLLAVEDSYTQEALSTEERERELRKSLQAAEESFRIASAQNSTISQEANLQLQSLNLEVEQLTEQRDNLLKKLGRVTHEHQNQVIALDNLTSVLEGFQREKDNDLKLAQKDYNEKLVTERQRQTALEEEINTLKEKLDAANQGLAAANRLSEQLETKAKIISTLKQEIRVREEQLKKAKQDLCSATVGNAGKVDKYLVKNLVVGYVAADADKRLDVLKIVATVLDFNQEERQKTGLEGSSSSSWLGSLFGQTDRRRRRSAAATEVQRATGLDQSLAQAFVAFLENESRPTKKSDQAAISEESQLQLTPSSSISSSVRTTPTSEIQGDPLPTSGTATFGRSSPGSNNPLLSSTSLTLGGSHALPTFSVNRSSSAILKSVLQEDRVTSGEQS